MTQEEKELLLKDLCARLPYMPKIKITYQQQGIKGTDEGNVSCDAIEHIVNDLRNGVITDMQIYLRPMSSMTEEEMDKVEMIMGVEDNKSIIFDFTSDGNIIFKNGNCSVCVFKKLIDYLYSCHFDFNNLIEKGLAIEVTEKNNPYEN